MSKKSGPTRPPDLWTSIDTSASAFGVIFASSSMIQLFQILTNGAIILGAFIILLLNTKGVRKTRDECVSVDIAGGAGI